MLMAMLERKKEIGVLMANGMNDKKILKMFFTEGFTNGALGCLIGFILGSILFSEKELKQVKLIISYTKAIFLKPTKENSFKKVLDAVKPVDLPAMNLNFQLKMKQSLNKCRMMI